MHTSLSRSYQVTLSKIRCLTSHFVASLAVGILTHAHRSARFGPPHTHVMMKLLCVALLAVACTCFSPASTAARSRSARFSISRGSESSEATTPQRPATRGAPVPSAVLAAMLAASVLTSPIAARADSCAVDCMKECTALAPGAANQAYCTSQCDGFCGGASSAAKEVRARRTLGRRDRDARARARRAANGPSPHQQKHGSGSGANAR